MNKVEPIWKDGREIDGIWEIGLPEDVAEGWYVGHGGVTKIVCYLEDGPNPDGVPWFAVYVGEELGEAGEVIVRVPAHGFGVTYRRSET